MSNVKITRRTLVSGMGLGGMAIGATANVKAGAWRNNPDRAPAKAPNILVMMLDDLGYADFDCYGGEIGTPNADRLAKNGALYSNFHTTAVCSASRAALLTGLNHHSVGMGWLADADNGTPGYRGDLSHDAPTMAEHFRARGWATYHIGKWHLNSVVNDSNLGDPANWPLQRGFDRAYWFHGHSSDYFRPAEFREGNSTIEIEPSDDYYVTDDLTDRAIADVRRHQAMAPDKPFFMYVAHAAPHSPLQARPEDMPPVIGRYDRGWDSVRDTRLARQKEFGLVPRNAELPDRDANVKAWDVLTADEKRVHARYQEVYAAVVRRLDWNIGRLTDALQEADLLDNTIVVLTSDNGGAPDAGPDGTPNLLAGSAGGVSIAQAAEMIDAIGGPDSCAAYPMGWAMASCTPYRMYKHHTFGGGIADPLIVHWPAGIRQPGAIRRQYVHVIDLLPTLLAAAGIEPLRTAGARSAKPIEGASNLASFSDPAAPSARTEQYYEMEGKRAYHADGWEIVSSRNYGQPLEADRWELFDARRDFNQRHDLSERYPEKLAELERKWWTAAERYQVLPLDLRTTAERYFASLAEGGGRSRWTIHPPMERLLAHGSPPMLGRSHSIEARVVIGPEDEGVIAAYGNMFLGCVLYIKDGELIYEAQARPHRYEIRTPAPRSGREHRIRFECRMTQRPFTGSATLSVDGRQVGAIAERRLMFGRPYQGLEVGRNGGVPVSLSYPDAFPYTGKIRSVVVDVDTSPYTQSENDTLAAMLKKRSS
jgi:arylsulfatase